MPAVPPEPAQAGGEGGPAEALQALGKGLSEVAGAIAQDPEAPEEAKAAFQAAIEAFEAGVQALQGGGAPQPSGPVSMEQGASGARPMSPGGPR